MPLRHASSTVSPAFIFSDRGRFLTLMLPSPISWWDSTRIWPKPFLMLTLATLTVRLGGHESSREISPSTNSIQRFVTFLVPGSIPQRVKWVDMRVLSQPTSPLGDPTWSGFTYLGPLETSCS
eukprot:Gb_26960 [translate_table: standard]